MNNREFIKIGQDLKILVDVTELGEDVTLDDIAYSLVFTSGSHSVTFAATLSGTTQTLATGMRRVNDHQVIVALPTTGFDRGNLMLKIVAEIPDTDFADGKRHEEREVDQMITLE